LTPALRLAEPAAQAALLEQPRGSLAVELEPFPDAIDLSVVLPTFNEARNIVAVVQELDAALSGLAGVSYEIIVVDDDSPDRTWELAYEYALKSGLTQVRVIRRQGERGLATAVVRGWQAARGRLLGVMDADLQHPPEVMPRLFAAIMDGATVAVGSRGVEGGGVSDWSLIRRMISRAAQLAGLIILPEVVGRVSDPMSGCFLLRRAALTGVGLNPKGYKILIEVLGRGNVPRIDEVGYVFRERRRGSSKVSAKIYLEYLQHLLQLRIALLFKNTFVRFCMVGSFGVLVDMLTLYLLSDPSTLHWGLTRSKIIGAELALISNFLMNDAWTFASRIGANRGARAKFQRFLKFNVVCSLGLALNILILNVLFNWFGTNRYVANAIAIVLVTVWNYSLNLKLGWRTASVADKPRAPPFKIL
jgi:dolichol-phosphate mannosyltransferase